MKNFSYWEYLVKHVPVRVRLVEILCIHFVVLKQRVHCA